MDHLLVSLIASVELEVDLLSGLTYLLEADPPNLKLSKAVFITYLYVSLVVTFEYEYTP